MIDLVKELLIIALEDKTDNPIQIAEAFGEVRSQLIMHSEFVDSQKLLQLSIIVEFLDQKRAEYARQIRLAS